MSKISDYELKGVSQQVVDFAEDVRDLLNNGKFQASVATTGIPGWSANTGEFAFFSSGSDRRLYVRASSAWQLVAGFDSTLSPSELGTASAGTGNTFAVVDHIHGGSFVLPTAAPDTPVANRLYRQSLCQAWVQFNGTGTLAINDDLNVSSLTDNGVGNYTVNFATAFAAANWCAVGSSDSTETDLGSPEIGSRLIRTRSSTGTLQDSTNVMMVCFGDQ